ncbi:MAG: NAD-dependent deacetylase [Candidatus Hermodarchaeota archaeon]
MNELNNKIEKFAQLILESNEIVVLSGAGMSTESGIPDFRSPNTGLWTKVNPDEFASIHSYVSDTGKNLKFMLDLGLTIFKAKPNKGHKALTKLQKLGKLIGVLTQNIDGLHQKARTQNVIELHGTVNEAKCMRCGRIFPITSMINQVLKGAYTPSCEICFGLLKPNAIFFGEPLESKILVKADEMIAKCDLLIVLGSSLLVYPVAFYPHKALSNGAKIAIINIQKTEIDPHAEIVIHEKIGDILPKIIKIVLDKINH